MSNKTKNIFLIALIVLFVINIAALITIIAVNKKANHPEKNCSGQLFEGRKHFENFMYNELDLSESQKDSFIKIKHDFVKQTRSITHEMRANQNRIFKELKKDAPDQELIDNYTQVMADDFIRLKRLSNQHFLKIKKVLNKEQEDVFFSKMKKDSIEGDPLSGRKRKHKGPSRN
ncbi:MAG: hypothetical protein HN600_13330 [Bacteroidetes bacterium]|nr:hypothetical protein [Bacteroidota bacterium]MBT7994798.1 hypothetical protein [Bacteroidota bacterium]